MQLLADRNKPFSVAVIPKRHSAKVILAMPRMNINDRDKNVYNETYSGNRLTTTDEAGNFEFTPEVEQFCLVVIHADGVGMITEADLADSTEIAIEAWNEENQQMQIIRRPTKDQSVDFPPRK